MMEDSSDVNSDELEELAKNFSKNVSATVENLVKKLQKEKLANQNLSASFTEIKEKNEFLKLEVGEVRKENKSLKENMQAIHALLPQSKEKVQGVQISDSNEGEDQIYDQMFPGQQAVQTPDEAVCFDAANFLDQQTCSISETEFESKIEVIEHVKLEHSDGIEANSLHQKGSFTSSTNEESLDLNSEEEEIERIGDEQLASFRFKKSLEKQQISDLMPDQQAVETPDGQLQVIAQSEEQQQLHTASFCEFLSSFK